MVLDTTTQFDRDVKRQEKRGKSLDKLHEIIETLRTRRPVGPKHKDHPLGGEWKGWRDCHVEPDWVLIHRKDDVTLHNLAAPVRTSTCSNDRPHQSAPRPQRSRPFASGS